MTMEKRDEAEEHTAAASPYRRSSATPRLETTIRMTLAVFVSYSLSYADLPNIIPPSQKWLVGLLGSVIAMRIPTYIFACGAMLPLFFTVLVFGLGSVTAILAAATVSDSLFIIACALWSFWVSSFRYGSFGKLTYIFPGVLISFLGIVGLGVYEYVTEGIEVFVSRGALQTLAAASGSGTNVNNVPGSFQPYLPRIMQAVQTLLSGVTDGRGVDFVPKAGSLAGQTIHVGLAGERGISISVEGGIWLLKLFWTESGLDNSLAVMKNFLVATSWAILCAFISPLLPIWRTSRKDTTQVFVPTMLRDAASFVRSRDDTIVQNTSSIDAEDAPREHVKPKEASIVVLRKRMLEYSNDVNGGTTSALYTSFEPRVWDYRPGEPVVCTWMALLSLLDTIESTILSTLACQVLAGSDADLPIVQKEGLAIIFEKCAIALESRTVVGQTEENEKERPDSNYCFDMSDVAADLCTKTDEWIKSLDTAKQDTNITTRESWKNLAKNTMPWIGPPMLFFLRLVEFIMLPPLVFKGKRRFDTGKFAHHVKFSIGFTILVSMSLYWATFRDLEVVDDEDGSDNISLAISPPESFSGWVLISYAFATMSTAEGTVKKCVLRILGTLVGAFSVWLALVVSSENEIGMVAWLTVTSFVAIYVSVDQNSLIKARMGTSTDYGYGGFYFVLTQSVISMEFLGGLGSRNDLVASRILSNVVGILMATLLSIVPPTVYGGDPFRASLILDEIKDALPRLLKLVLASDAEGLRKFRDQHLKAVRKQRADVMYLLEDAKRLSMFPFYQVDPKLELEVGSMACTSFLVYTLAGFVADSLDDDVPVLDNTDECATMLQNLDSAASHDNLSDVVCGEDDNAFLRCIRTVHERVGVHRDALSTIKWGFR